MSARDFIKNALIPFIEAELADKPQEENGNYVTGIDMTLSLIKSIIERHRKEWDVKE